MMISICCKSVFCVLNELFRDMKQNDLKSAGNIFHVDRVAELLLWTNLVTTDR